MRAAAIALTLLASGCAGLAGMRAEDEASRDLAAPAALRAESGELRRVPLVWQPVASRDVAGYVVERAHPGEETYARVVVLTGRFQTSHVDDDELRDESRYRYRVRSLATDGGVGVPVSPVASARTAGPPSAPRGLQAISHLPRQVALQWRAARDPEVMGYVVQRSPAADGPFLPVAHPEGRFSTTWVDRDLDDLRVFYYRVASRNAVGVEGKPGASVQAVTKAEPLPPIGLRVEVKRLGANRLAWDPNVERDVAGYRLLRGPIGGGELATVATLPAEASSAEDSQVAAGEALVYRLVAIDADGLESAPSDPVEVHGEGYQLAAQPAEGGIGLRWNPRREEGYQAARVYRVGRLRRTELARVDGDAFVDAAAVPGRTYHYAVVLERADGTRAPFSTVVEAALPDSAATPAP
jgi:fibronectin type 3 domain-containing protein